jgi:hypothetical protein
MMTKGTERNPKFLNKNGRDSVLSKEQGGGDDDQEDNVCCGVELDHILVEENGADDEGCSEEEEGAGLGFRI